MAEDGDHEESSVVIPFPSITPQQYGRDYEKRKAREDGYRAHPASGAGSIKHDASDEYTVVEYKTANKVFSLNGSYLESLFKVSVRQGKDAMMEVYFIDANVTATISLKKGTDRP